MSLGERVFNVVIVPWPPRISTHPPSMFFCSFAPRERAGRDLAWAFRGVVNARDVRNSFVSGWVFSHAEVLNILHLRIHPRVPPHVIAVRACSFSERGRVLSLSGRIIVQVSRVPIITVAWARVSIGPIVNRWGWS